MKLAQKIRMVQIQMQIILTTKYNNNDEYKFEKANEITANGNNNSNKFEDKERKVRIYEL